MFLPFGRYRGRLVRDLPDDYLEWLSLQPDLRDPLRRCVKLERDRRTNQALQDDPRETDQSFALYVAPDKLAVLHKFVDDGYRQFPRRKEQGLYELSDDIRQLRNVLRSLRKQLKRGMVNNK